MERSYVAVNYHWTYEIIKSEDYLLQEMCLVASEGKVCYINIVEVVLKDNSVEILELEERI